MNLSPVRYWTTEFPFADLMKNNGGWGVYREPGASAAPVPVTSEGYPLALLPGQHVRAAVAWQGTGYAAGQYTVLWDGDGSISFPLSRLAIRSKAQNRIVVEVADSSEQMWVSIDRTNPKDPVRNVRFLWPGTESSYATQPFNPEFLKRMAPFSKLRFMDWAGTNNSKAVDWKDRTPVNAATWAGANGVPVEVMIDLANTLRADPWFCVPHQASDDYVRRFAELIRDRLDPKLRPHIEYSNEVWNWGFQQTRWAVEQSDKMGLPRPWGTPSAFYAQRSVEIFRIFDDVYGPARRGELVRVIAGQAAWTQFQDNALAFRDTAASVDVLAIAPYFDSGAAGDPKRVDASLAMTADDLIAEMRTSVRGTVRKRIEANAALARKHRLTLMAYESGPHDTAVAFAPEKHDAITKLFARAHRDPRIKDVYAEYYALWIENGGDAMLQFNGIGSWSKFGLWGALEYVTQDPASAPKYQALLEVIARYPLQR